MADNPFENIHISDDPPSEKLPSANIQFDFDVLSMKQQIAKRYDQDTRFRKHLANWVMWIVPGWLLVVLGIVFIALFKNGLDASVLIALLATTTANVLGLAYIVLKGIFHE